MADKTFAEFFIQSGGASGVVPPFPIKRYANNASKGLCVDGFAADGDYIVFPASGATAATIEYYNNAGTLVWSKTVASVFGSAGNWIGFHMTAGGVLYALGHVTAGTLLRLATINAAGANTLIGAGFVPSPAINTTAGGDAFATSPEEGVTFMEVSGGNLLLVVENRQININAATGALTSQTTFRTAKGAALSSAHYLGLRVFDSEYMPHIILTKGNRRGEFSVPRGHELSGVGSAESSSPEFNAMGPISWRGELVAMGAPTRGLLVFDPTQFASSVSALVSNTNFNL